ncbi:MAG: hypothetical protein ACI4EF_09625 [Coprococcus sp.]
MVNGEKVILMTKLAMYEQSLGREDLDKGKFFKSDYVKYNCLKTLISTTILFWIVVAAYVYYNLDTIMEEFASMDYLGIAYKLIVYYAITCVVFMALAWILYSYRYMKAKPKLIKYNQNLKKLIEFYDKQGKTKNPVKKRRVQ